MSTTSPTSLRKNGSINLFIAKWSKGNYISQRNKIQLKLFSKCVSIKYLF